MKSFAVITALTMALGSAAGAQRGVQGGIVEREAALHLSNVMLWNPATKKGDRVGVRALADGRRVRYFKSNDEVVDA